MEQMSKLAEIKSSPAMMQQKLGEMDYVRRMNGLKYELPDKINVCERRSNKVNYADKDNYSSGEMVIKFNGSTDYVYGPNSYLTFKVSAVRNAGNDPVGFADYTALALFSNVLLESKSGEELERFNELDCYAAQVVPWKVDSEGDRTILAAAGQYDHVAYENYVLPHGELTEYDCSTDLTVCIPLRLFLGVFDREVLIPPMLLGGAQLRLTLAPANRAFQKLGVPDPVTTASVTSYTISEPRVIVDSLALHPVLQRNLIEESQQNGGLDFVYHTIFGQRTSKNSKNFNFQLNKAVTRCNRMYFSTQNAGVDNSLTENNLGTSAFNIAAYDSRVGDLYFPTRKLVVPTPVPKNGSEMYINTIQSLGKLKKWQIMPCVGKRQYLYDDVTVPAGNNNGRSCHVQSFEHSTTLESSGLALNNSRTLELRIEKDDTTDTDYLLWIEYTKSAKCNAVRTVVKE